MNNIYNLNDQVKKFGDILHLLYRASKSWNDRVICSQLVWAGTSVSVNYAEAGRTEENSTFKDKLKESIKDLKESCHWLEILKKFNYEDTLVKAAQKEAQGLVRDFSKIIRKVND